MGITGWAEAASKTDNDNAKTNSHVHQQSDQDKQGGEIVPDDGIVCSTAKDASDDDNDGWISLDTLNDNASSSDSATYDYDHLNEVGHEPIAAIRALKLSGSKEAHTCDITQFELHEIQFLLEHAERQGFKDYYRVVLEVFKVKHRILDELGDVDSISSPNLDELLSYVESRYEQSVSGEE